MAINDIFKKKFTTEGMYIGKPEAEAERVDTHALFQDYLNIENAISAVYLVYENSLELEMVCKLVGDTVPVKIFTHFFAQDNSAIPMLTDYK